MTEDTFKDLCLCGETTKVQFKESFTSQKEIAKEMIAFANTKGGVILFGVEDKCGKLVGLSYDEIQLGIVVFVFRSSKHIGRTFGSTLAFHQAPFATIVDGMFVRDELLDFESSTIDIVVGIGTVEGFLHLATFFLRDRLSVRILVSGIVQINL